MTFAPQRRDHSHKMVVKSKLVNAQLAVIGAGLVVRQKERTTIDVSHRTSEHIPMEA